MSKKQDSIKAQSRAHIAYLALHNKKEFDKVSNKDKWLPENMKKEDSLCRHGGMGKKASLASGLIGLSQIEMQGTSLYKEAISLVEYDPVQPMGRSNEKKSKSEVYYRKGSKDEKCKNCTNFSSGTSCRVVDGMVKEDAVCDRFDDNGNEDEGQSKTAMRKGSPGLSCSMCINNTGGICKTAGVFPEPSDVCDEFCTDTGKLSAILGSRTKFVRDIFSKQANATLPTVQSPQSGRSSAGASLASLLDGEIEENKQLRQQITSIQQQQATAGQIDPATGQPVQPPPAVAGPAPVDPGVQQQIDPATGQPMQQQEIDPNTGQPLPPQEIDPNTGQPLPPQPPPPSDEEIQLSQSLNESGAEIERMTKEIERLKDQNRALHHSVEPSDMNDVSKKMYDRAGTDIQDTQEIPNENIEPDNKMPQGDLRRLLDQSLAG